MLLLYTVDIYISINKIPKVVVHIAYIFIKYNIKKNGWVLLFLAFRVVCINQLSISKVENENEIKDENKNERENENEKIF